MLLWDTVWNGSVLDWGYGVAVDSNDNIIITGYTGNFTVHAFVVKYSGSGVLLWEAIGAGFDADYGVSVAVDSQDNIVVTGVAANMTWETIGALVAKYSDSGNLLWNTFWNNSVDDLGYDVAVDSDDNIIITGYAANFTYPGLEVDAFVAKFGFVLTVSVYTDKTVYSAHDVMILGLDVANWNDDVNVGFALWITLPDGSKHPYMYKPSIALQAKLDYSNPSFETFVLPNIPHGVYTWHTALLHPTTHTILIEDTAEWEFV